MSSSAKLGRETLHTCRSECVLQDGLTRNEWRTVAAIRNTAQQNLDVGRAWKEARD